VSVAIKSKLDRVLANLIVLKQERASEFRATAEAVRNYATELVAFKSGARITRPAREPQSRPMLIAIVFALFMIDTPVNGVLFAKALEGGPLEGLVYAGSIGAINVGIGFLVGRFLIPARNYVSLGIRLAGYVSIAAFVVWTVGLNMTISALSRGGRGGVR
jgi:hypothetical protein